MLNNTKQIKLLASLKLYNKKFLSGSITELDESGTRLMINSFLTDVLGYAPIEEVRTEYMIKGTYADYVVQIKGTRHFLVEVKALSLDLSDKHLRQAINYGANEGIEWALLTNGKQFDFYRILFEKPIEARKVFSLDLCDGTKLKQYVDVIQYLTKDCVINKGLDMLWSKTVALDPKHVAGFLFAQPVMNFIRKTLKEKFKNAKFTDEEIENSLCRIVREPILMESIKQMKIRKPAKKKPSEPKVDLDQPITFVIEDAMKNCTTNAVN